MGRERMDGHGRRAIQLMSFRHASIASARTRVNVAGTEPDRRPFRRETGRAGWFGDARWLIPEAPRPGAPQGTDGAA